MFLQKQVNEEVQAEADKRGASDDDNDLCVIIFACKVSAYKIFVCNLRPLGCVPFGVN